MAVTLRMSLTSTAVSAMIGIPIGLFLGKTDFKGKSALVSVIHTFMSLPPVVAGLVVFLLLSNSGPLGRARLLFSVPAMVIAQIILIGPIITGLSLSAAGVRAPMIAATAGGMGFSARKELFLLLHECRVPLVSVVLTGFGRALAEVGAVSLVGGNIQYKTRVLTTAIMLETNKGNFEFALALGLVLLSLAFVVNILARRVEKVAEYKRSGSGGR